MSITFDHTSSGYDYDTEGAPTNGYDISEFNNDTRGTAVVTDWNHVKNLDEDGFDDLCSDLDVTQGTSSFFWISWEDSTYLSGGESGNKYYRDLDTDQGYMLAIAWDSDPKFGSSSPSNVIYLNSRFDRKALYLAPRNLSIARKVMVSFVSAGAQGDPHINPIFGSRYTI